MPIHASFRLRLIGGFISAAMVLLCGCNDSRNSSAAAAATPTATSPTVTTPTAGANSAPTIVGTPGNSIAVGSSYRFVPVAADADGDRLVFSINNRPSWASFSADMGELSGTPTAADVGDYGGIQVSVSDGKASSSLAMFTLTVVAANLSPAANGSATLAWQAPTLNEDGTPLVGLAGYRILYGKDPNALDLSVKLEGADNTRYTIEGLSAGTYYFGVASVTADGVESRLSGLASKTIA